MEGWDGGRPLSVHARAPLRVDFAGGWTDVPEYADRRGGVVVAAGLSLSVHVDAYLGGRRIVLLADDIGERVVYQTSGEIRYDGRLDLHKAALNLLPVTGGIELSSRSDAPGGSGLGASGALDVALVATLALCRREPYDELALAELGFTLETEELGLVGGRQDQLTAALGGFQRYGFRADQVDARRLSVAPAEADDLQRHTLIVFTGHSHFSSATHEHVWKGFRQGDTVVEGALAEIADLAERASEQLERADWHGLAQTITANWAAQRRLHPTIAAGRIQDVEAAVRAAGAWGLKATGAGAGGCVFVMCAPPEREQVMAAATGAGARVLPFEFAFEGVNVWEKDDDAAQ